MTDRKQEEKGQEAGSKGERWSFRSSALEGQDLHPYSATHARWGNGLLSLLPSPLLLPVSLRPSSPSVGESLVNFQQQKLIQ
jgi:hypothetical protein